jgi:hypothetical protein
MKSHFDELIDELTRAKAVSIDTAEDDAQIAAAAGEDGAAEDTHPTDAAIGRVLRQAVAAITQLRKDVTALQRKVAELEARGAVPMRKALHGGQGAKGVDRAEFLHRAMAAQAAGRINGTQVAVAEAHINAGKQPPREIAQAVLEAEAA